jgi:hypothetical protein
VIVVELLGGLGGEIVEALDRRIVVATSDRFARLSRERARDRQVYSAAVFSAMRAAATPRALSG